MRTVFALLSLSSSLPVSEVIEKEIFAGHRACFQDEFIGTTAATPDLPDFLFKHFGEPPLTDSQMLNILIGRMVSQLLKVYSNLSLGKHSVTNKHEHGNPS